MEVRESKPSKVGPCWLLFQHCLLTCNADLLHWLLLCALYYYQTAKAHTLCVYMDNCARSSPQLSINGQFERFQPGHLLLGPSLCAVCLVDSGRVCPYLRMFASSLTTDSLYVRLKFTMTAEHNLFTEC